MIRYIESFKSYYRANYNQSHINDNIDWCIQRGIPSLSYYYANPYVEFSDYMRNIGDTVTINTERLV